MDDELSFRCLRKYTFFSRTYYLKLKDSLIIISQNQNFSSPKYILEVKLSSQLIWKVSQKQIKALGIIHQDKIKYFEATHKDLLALKNTLGCRVVFRNMASFYQPIEVIGEGQSAQVIRSVDLLTGEVCAVKMIKKEFGLEQKAMEVVKNEIQVLRNLNHPNIIRTKEVYFNDDTFWMVQEYVPGVPLSEALKQKLSNRQVKKIMTQLLLTIQYFQSISVVHRDIKPENIILNDLQSVNIKIIDFGFATSLKSTQIHSVCGTPGYFAPEVLSKKECGFNSDMFSAGVVFYNLLTGKPLLRAQLNSTKKPIADEYAEDLLIKMLENDPLKRINAEQALCHPYFDDFAFPLISIEEGERHECYSNDVKSIKSFRTQKTKPN